MSAAKPVIGYDAGGTTELVVNEVTGLLYRGDEKELAACMRRLIEQPLWARKLGEAGWKKARKKYTIEICAKNVYSILYNLVE